MSNIAKALKVYGIVQGVGFRPFIVKLALNLGLTGCVRNTSYGVEIKINGPKASVDSFCFKMENDSPELSRIISVITQNAEYDPSATSFEIWPSEKTNSHSCIVLPDASVCHECLEELFTPSSRYYLYPFINCTNCGPRYSIIQSMPYDRSATTMSKFKMCPECESEYLDISSRRYHAQPVACEHCGPQLWVEDTRGEKIDCEDGVSFAIERLKEGKIIALKSNGGFHFICDAYNEHALNTLRQRKSRQFKAFAVMVSKKEELQEIANFSDFEFRVLEGVERPIVLMDKKKNKTTEHIAPRNSKIGVLFPSTPLHYLLFSEDSLKCLIFTSANKPSLPTITENQAARQQLTSIADYIVFNDRDIHSRADDSIVKVAKFGGAPQTQVIRNGRGYAPRMVKLPVPLAPSLAAGSQMKNCISLSNQDYVFVGTHVGDINNEQCLDEHVNAAKQLQTILNIEPLNVAVDSHPGFYYLRHYDKLATTPSKIQHHHAHMNACMLDNGLTDDLVLGVIFDGTGFGGENDIWGGEILYGNYRDAKRVASINRFKLLGGDKAVKEPLRVVSALLALVGCNDKQANKLAVVKNNREKYIAYQKLILKELSTIDTSSMGRLIDGLASMVLGVDSVEYDAQLAIELESLLCNDFTKSTPYTYEITNDSGIPRFNFHSMILELIEDIESLVSPEVLSRKIHSTIVDATESLVMQCAKKYSCYKVVLSGGAFVNEFLSKNLYEDLTNNGMKVYYHKDIPCGDGGISAGQLMKNASISETKLTKRNSNENSKLEPAESFS